MGRVKSRYVSFFEIEKGESVYRLMGQLSSPMNQNALADFYNRSKEKGNPLPMNALQHIRFLEDVAMSNDVDLKNYVSQCLHQNDILTTSRLIISSEGYKDEVIHNYGTLDAYSVYGKIEAKAGDIDSMDKPHVLKYLVGTRGIKKLNKISNAITGGQMFIADGLSWDFRPLEGTKERAINLAKRGKGLCLWTTDDLRDENPAFLMERVK